MNEQNVTHIALPVEAYQKLGQFLTSLPYNQVAQVIPYLEQAAKAYEETALDSDGGSTLEAVVSGDSGAE